LGLKYSLEIFPKSVDGECCGFAATKWKEGFEKELKIWLDSPHIEYISAKQMIEAILGRREG